MSTEPQAIDYTELGTFPDYAAAQELVRRLSDAGFEVRRLRIVGNDLHSVEQVTGRMTVGKASGSGQRSMVRPAHSAEASRLMAR